VENRLNLNVPRHQKISFLSGMLTSGLHRPLRRCGAGSQLYETLWTTGTRFFMVVSKLRALKFSSLGSLETSTLAWLFIRHDCLISAC
jgi:hypothetical protein